MINAIKMRLVVVFEYIMEKGFLSYLRQVIYINRRAILVERTLIGLDGSNRFLQQSNLHFEEITLDKIKRNNYTFLVNNRHIKAFHYLNEGYGGHAIMRGNEVVGDIWYSATNKSDRVTVHPDVNKFGINSSIDFAYSFDQFVVPTERGNMVAAALLNGQLLSLFQKGYSKVYGYCWADNTPALWNTLVMNKFKEIGSLRVNRYFFFKTMIPNNKSNL